MAWKERSRMDERVVLVSEYVKGERSMAELCREFGISRKTAYKCNVSRCPVLISA